MIRYRVKRGDFMAMSTIATNLSKEKAEDIEREENIACDSYTIVEVEPYEETEFKFGK